MKKFLFVVALFTLCGQVAFAKPQLRVTHGLRAQTVGHSVALSWVLSTDDTTSGCAAPNTCSQTIYRSLGSCTATPTFTTIGSPTSSTATFTDTTVVPGTYCYAVTFTQNGLESAKDITTVTLPPFAPTGMAGTPH